MSTFQALVEDYVGAVSDTTALTDWLTSGAKSILNILPPEKIEKYTSAVAVTNGTTSLAQYRLASVVRENIQARPVSSAFIQRAGDSSSIHYATSLTPVYALVNGVANVKPTSGTGATATALMGLNATITITNGGSDYAVGETFTLDGTDHGTGTHTHSVITITSVDTLNSNEVTGVTLTTVGSYPVLPTIPGTLTHGGNLTSNTNNGSGAVFTVTWGVIGATITAGGSGYSSTFPPSILFSAGGAQATATVSATGIVTALTITMAGSYLAVPTISVAGIVAYAVAYPTVAYSDSAITGFPTELFQALVLYTAIKAAVYKAFASVNVSAAINTFLSIPAPILSVIAPSWTDAAAATFTGTTIGSLGTVPTYTQPVLPVSSLSDSATALTAEDIELSEGHLSKQKSYLESYQLDIQNELNKFNKELSVYQTTVQSAIEQARLDQERLMLQAKTTSDINMQNEIQEVANEVNTYRLAVEKYATEIQLYGQEVNAEVSKLSTMLSKGIQETQVYIALVPVLKQEYKEVIEAYLV